MRFILKLLCHSAILLFIARIIPGINLTGWWSAIITALVLGFFNALVRPILLLLTLPINLITLGLFTFVINGFLFWLTSTVVKGFTIVGWVTALFGAFLMTLASWVVNWLLDDSE